MSVYGFLVSVLNLRRKLAPARSVQDLPGVRGTDEPHDLRGADPPWRGAIEEESRGVREVSGTNGANLEPLFILTRDEFSIAVQAIVGEVLDKVFDQLDGIGKYSIADETQDRIEVWLARFEAAQR